ncbi:hypothetical protein BJ742DRAFT_766388 [Cladochytrium replicatum]|nr:hypothetical protein BJ742DRAFT_766388 [Cladochytrium replicatum]
MGKVLVLIALLALVSTAVGAVAFRAPGADEYRSGQQPPTLLPRLWWTPIAPPVVDSDGYVYHMLVAAAYTSPPQTFLKLAVLNFGGTSSSENVAANAGVVADINVGGGDTACLFWVATDASFRPTDVSVYSVFGQDIHIRREPSYMEYIFINSVEGATTSATAGATAACLLRFNIETGTRTGNNVTECKDIINLATAAPAGLTVGAPTDIAPLSPQLSAVYSGLGYTDGGANQMLLLSSSVGDVMFNASWGLLPFSLSSLAAPSASSGVGGGGGSAGSNLQIRTVSSWIDVVVALNGDGVALRKVDRLSPQLSSVVWSATNAQIGHTSTLAKSIVAIDAIVIAVVAVTAAAAVVLFIRRRRTNKRGDKQKGDATTAVISSRSSGAQQSNLAVGGMIFSVFPHSRHNQNSTQSSRGGATVGYIGDDDGDDIHMEELSEVSRVVGGSSAASEVGTKLFQLLQPWSISNKHSQGTK